MWSLTFCAGFRLRNLSRALFGAAVGATACVPQDGWGESAPKPALAAEVNAPWIDNYQRTHLGADYRATSSAWSIQQGQVCARAAKNHPLWLERLLPDNVRIDFDAHSNTADGDIKVEIFGDGKSFSDTNSYTNASSYLAIFGGWRNQRHVFSRLNEHDPGRLAHALTQAAEAPELRPLRAGQSYHFRIERSDRKTVRVWLDGRDLFAFTDPNPLLGTGHEYFGFNNWEAPVCFDNLTIVAL